MGVVKTQSVRSAKAKVEIKVFRAVRISKKINLIFKKMVNRKHSVVACNHRHISNIACLMAHTACLVCFISTVNGHNKKRSLGNPALVEGT